MNTALQILALIIHLEGGWMPNNSFRIYDSTWWHDTGVNQFYITLGIEFEIVNFFFVGGDIRTEMHIEYPPRSLCAPQLENYCFYFGIRPMNGLEIGFRHRCIHPVIPYMTDEKIYLNYEGGYEEVYIKFDKRIDLF